MPDDVWCRSGSTGDAGMKSGLTIREDNYSVVLDALKQLSGTDVLVGIPAGPPRDDAPLSNAELGYLQSTGATVEIGGETVTLPPRPFLDMGIEDSRDKTTERLKLAAQSALEVRQMWRRCILKPQARLRVMPQRLSLRQAIV